MNSGIENNNRNSIKYRPITLDKPLIPQVKENGKLAGKMLVMVESTLEVHKTDSSLNSFTLNYFFNIFSHNRISPLSYIKSI